MFYALEPLFPQPHRDELWRYDVKILIWRCKSKLTYLERVFDKAILVMAIRREGSNAKWISGL